MDQEAVVAPAVAGDLVEVLAVAGASVVEGRVDPVDAEALAARRIDPRTEAFGAAGAGDPDTTAEAAAWAACSASYSCR